MNENRLHEEEHSISFIQMVMITGFVGGALWSLVAYLAYYFQFTSIEPNIILEPFTVGNWKESWIGIVIAVFAYGIVSIGAAFLYYILLKKAETMWMGIIYGAVLFLIVFFILNPIFPSMKPFTQLKLNTIITCLCIYILYGVFIGYSISFEQGNIAHTRRRLKEEENLKQTE